jgi:hypothetical protein
MLYDLPYFVFKSITVCIKYMYQRAKSSCGLFSGNVHATNISYDLQKKGENHQVVISKRKKERKKKFNMHSQPNPSKEVGKPRRLLSTDDKNRLLSLETFGHDHCCILTTFAFTINFEAGDSRYHNLLHHYGITVLGTSKSYDTYKVLVKR